jgi:hypothetical protein
MWFRLVKPGGAGGLAAGGRGGGDGRVEGPAGPGRARWPWGQSGWTAGAGGAPCCHGAGNHGPDERAPTGIHLSALREFARSESSSISGKDSHLGPLLAPESRILLDIREGFASRPSRNRRRQDSSRPGGPPPGPHHPHHRGRSGRPGAPTPWTTGRSQADQPGSPGVNLRSQDRGGPQPSGWRSNPDRSYRSPGGGRSTPGRASGAFGPPRARYTP